MVFLRWMASFSPWLLVTLAAISVILGDVFAKYWSQNQRLTYYLLGLVFYFLSGFLYIPSLLKEGLVVTSVLWSLIGTIGFVVVGLVFFKETLTLMQGVGVGFGVVALVILAFSL